MSALYLVGALLEGALVIAFAMTFSTFVAFAIIRGVIWATRTRQYNEADDSSPAPALSRRVLSSHWLHSSHSGVEGGVYERAPRTDC